MDLPRDFGSIRLVHLAPDTILDRYGAGNWKDLQGRSIAFDRLGIVSRTAGFSVDDPVAVVSEVPRDTTDVMLEYSGRPELMQALIERCPSVQIHLRMHNAEALQHWHRARIGVWPSRSNLRNIYGVARLAWLDRCSVKMADSRLGISPWDNENYWRRLSRKDYLTLPYFSPWPYLRPQVDLPAYKQRPNRIVCMPGGGDRLSRQQSELFHRIASGVQRLDNRRDHEFLISGGVLGNAPALQSCVQQKPFDQPWDELAQSRAVAVLTDLGFGMKTTIVDGLAAGVHVLVHAGLLKRLPPDIAAAVHAVDPDDPRLTESIVERLQGPPPDGKSINTALRDKAVETLARVLNVVIAPSSRLSA